MNNLKLNKEKVSIAKNWGKPGKFSSCEFDVTRHWKKQENTYFIKVMSQRKLKVNGVFNKTDIDYVFFH